MKTEFKNGDKVIWTDGKEYAFIGASSHETDYTNKLDCVIERNSSITYAISADLKLKPETVTHPGGEIPRPCDNAGAMLKAGVAYRGIYAIMPGNSHVIAPPSYVKSIEAAKLLADSKMFHLNESSAIAHAKVIYQIKD